MKDNPPATPSQIFLPAHQISAIVADFTGSAMIEAIADIDPATAFAFARYGTEENYFDGSHNGRPVKMGDRRRNSPTSK